LKVNVGFWRWWRLVGVKHINDRVVGVRARAGARAAPRARGTLSASI